MFEISTKAAIYNELGTKVLVMKYRKGVHYGLPGGHLEHGETPDMAMKRELVEELGVEDDFALQPTDFFVHEGNTQRPRLILGYQGTIREDTAFVFASHDYEEEGVWMDQAEFAHAPVSDGYRTFVEKHWPVPSS
jgi:8-oxo-dGTP pyrophosphatase MutT (NUDIX family)